MRTGISITVSPSVGGAGTNAIMRQTGKSKTCVWRWQERFATEGFEGLLRDKTRPSRIKPLGDDVAARIEESRTRTRETNFAAAAICGRGCRRNRLRQRWAVTAPGSEAGKTGFSNVTRFPRPVAPLFLDAPPHYPARRHIRPAI